MATVVVTGVGGSLGRRVAARLAADGDRVVGIDAGEVDGLPPTVAVERLDLASDDPGTEGRIEGLVCGADVVVHLAWRTLDEGRRAAAAEAAAANQAALGRVLDAAGRARVAGVVQVSSATVYGAWPDNPVPLSEESPLRPNPELAYAVGKADSERLLAEWSEAHPTVAVAVLRPAATLGATTSPLYRALTGTGVARSDEATRLVQVLHVDDLASAVVLAVRRRLAGTYNVAPDGGIPEATARALAGGVAHLRLPGRVATLVGMGAWNLRRAGAPRAARAYRTYPWVVAPDKLKAAGWVPHYSTEEALVATDPRPHAHWDELPPGTRQNYTLLAVLTAAAGSVAAAGFGLAILLRRRRAAATKREGSAGCR
ncbi:MAG TPA: NAD-dependent epimerase/dehydratase family protein [Acidimicrobiales bacterium]|nr:NAD-dependent epimerase/dehydratase family protein [Acidimicrobiales bacterium]